MRVVVRAASPWHNACESYLSVPILSKHQTETGTKLLAQSFAVLV